MRVQKSLVISFLLSAALGVMPHEANAIVIDEFSENYPDRIELVGIGASVQTGVKTTSALGGARRAVVTKTNGTSRGKITHYVDPELGILAHNQESGQYGNTLTIWDGKSSGSTTPDITGLGGVDLTADGADAFYVKFFNGDMKDRVGATVIISVYKYGVAEPYTYTISNEVLPDDIVGYPFEVQFSKFKNDLGQTFDFKSVGAITMKINGDASADLDVSLYQFMTNGPCDYYIPEAAANSYTTALAAPASSYEEEATAPKICCATDRVGACGVCMDDTVNGVTNPVEYNTICFDCDNNKYGTLEFDACGICGGDGSTCQDCEGTFNGPAKKDLCNVCYHNAEADPNWNKTCVDCNGVPVLNPAERKQMDQCNVCGGDGTSCLDCFGVVNGSAEIDLCGKCIKGGKSNKKEWNMSCLDCNGNPNPDKATRKTLDYCGVCGGDNTGSDEIFGCETVDAAAIKDNTRNDLQTQKSYLNQMASRIKCSSKKNRKKIKKAAAKLVASSVSVLENFPASTRSCTSEIYCKTKNYNELVAGKGDLDDSSRTLFRKTKAAINARKACIQNGPCLKTYEQCLESKRLRNLQLRLDRALARKLRDSSIEQIKALPTATSNCDCKYAVM